MTLTCTKTGRWWPCLTAAHGEWLARQLGLKDYEVMAQIRAITA